MTTIATRTWRAALIGRWAARILGTLMVLFLLAFVFGEGPPPLARMNAREQLYSLGMGALFLGLIMAWFWEGWGGLLSVVGWGFLAVVDNGPQWDLPFSIPAAVGLLHLLCWWRLRGPTPPVQPLSSVTRARLGVLLVFFWAALGVFLLLCANEIFGQPPLMTGSSRPSADVVGTWSGNGIPVVFTIGPDG